MSDIVITGATGATGGATAAALSEIGVPFRALTRRPEVALPAGGAAVRADLEDADSVRTALAGAGSVYLVTPSSARAEALQRQFIDVAAEAGVQHVVLLSQLAAASDSTARFLRYHAHVEEHLAATGIASTVLRPNLFMQGLLLFREQLLQGVLPAPIGGAQVSVVDVRDIGAVAAAALADGPLGTLDLTGPQALTHAEMAHRLGDVIGRPVRFVSTPPREFAAAVGGFLPPWQVDGLLEDYAHYGAGEAAAISTGIRAVLGREPIGFTRFAADHAGTLQGQR